jgi:3-oxoacyl-[acyl-carrier-protein] synthase-1
MGMQAIRDDALYIVGCGAQTAIGRALPATSAAVRCGISAHTDHPFMVDQHGEPMVVAFASWLDIDDPARDRIALMAIATMQEALGPLVARSAISRLRMQIYAAFSEESLSDQTARQRLVDDVSSDSAILASPPPIDTVWQGHAGGFLALKAACNDLRLGKIHVGIVVGADSYIDPERLEDTDRVGRLHSSNQTWGFTPGEGAGCCIVVTGSLIRHLGLSSLAEVSAVATATEPKLMGTDSVCIGEGLTAAFRGVLSESLPIAHSYCDLNGETYRADEFGFAISRTSEFFQDVSQFTAAADCWGDVGAASALLATVLPVVAWQRGYANGPCVLAWSSSAHVPLRGAALLRQCSGWAG